MAILEIPIDKPDTLVNEISVFAELDGQKFLLDLSWSPQSEQWYLDLYSRGPDEKHSVILGVSLQLYFPVLAGVVGDNRPLGELMLWDTTGSFADCSHDDLGLRCRLMYYDAAELGR